MWNKTVADKVESWAVLNKWIDDDG
jgi:hypothetical protein